MSGEFYIVAECAVCGRMLDRAIDEVDGPKGVYRFCFCPSHPLAHVKYQVEPCLGSDDMAENQ